MAVSKRLRYEVLRRDNHTCRYCGASAPDVKLAVDHVLPVTLGGKDVPENLVAACGPCNAGKTSSNPDAPLVADVAQDVLRWHHAIAVATEKRRIDSANRFGTIEMILDFFISEFLDAYGQAPPVPLDAPIMLGTWLDAGIPSGTLGQLISVTVARSQTVQWDNLWRYFAGCCWNELRALEAQAHALIAAGEF